MDELRELQAAVRRYFDLERAADQATHDSLAKLNKRAESSEAQLHQARRKVLRLAGIDETE